MRSRVKTNWYKQLIRWNSKPIHKQIEMNQNKRKVHVFAMDIKEY